MLRINYKYVSFSMIIIMLALSVNGFCQGAHAAVLSFDAPSEHSASSLSAVEKKCPCCPVDEHSTPEHCDSSCHCSCHTLVTAQPILIASVLEIAPLAFFEPFKAFPEVYLPKFIPPDILA